MFGFRFVKILMDADAAGNAGGGGDGSAGATGSTGAANATGSTGTATQGQGGGAASGAAGATGATGGETGPAKVTLTVDELSNLYQFQRQFMDLKAEQTRAAEAAEQERLRLLAQKGEAETALKQQADSWQGKYAQLESAYLADKSGAVLATAMTGRDWVSPEAANQALSLIATEIEAVRNPADGTIVVRHKATGRPALDVAKERLDSPAFAHFQKAKSAGGTGATGGNGATATGNGSATDATAANAEMIARVRQAAGLGGLGLAVPPHLAARTLGLGGYDGK